MGQNEVVCYLLNIIISNMKPLLLLQSVVVVNNSFIIDSTKAQLGQNHHQYDVSIVIAIWEFLPC